MGTDDHLADADLPLTVGIKAREDLTGWDTVHGELMTFDDAGERLPAIDRLEGFRPGEESFYTRVLVPVVPVGGNGPLLAWAYAVGEGSGVRLPDGRWSA